MSQNPKAEIQLFYARIIDWAAKLGFLLVLMTFAVYITGMLTPYVPLEHLPRYWSLSASGYLEATHIQTGWAWLGELHHGDFLNYVPIAMLAGVTIFGYFCLVCKFFRNREVILGIMVILQIVVLLVAASGTLRIGGH